MNASIIVDQGIATGRHHQISRDVSRVGAGHSMTVRIEGLSDWAFTLFESQGEFYVLKRGDAELNIGADVVEEDGKRCRWPLGETARLADGTVLRLTASTGANETTWNEDELMADGNSVVERRARQIVIVGLATLVTIAYLCVFSSSNSSNVKVQVAFDELIGNLRSKKTPDDRRFRRSLSLLREGWMHELWADQEKAIESYERLRDHLATLASTDKEWSKDPWVIHLEARLNQFLVHRFGQLGSK